MKELHSILKTRADSTIYSGRELREINFNTGIYIGGFPAMDFFGDGSFYLLDAPGVSIISFLVQSGSKY